MQNSFVVDVIPYIVDEISVISIFSQKIQGRGKTFLAKDENIFF
jgi:hypothetical protein